MKKFNLFSNCILVDGQCRSMICDIQRGKYFFIPNDLFFILKSFKDCSMQEIREQYGVENSEAIDQYFDFLIQEDLGFYMDENDSIAEFPEFNLEWNVPSSVTNSIIEINQGKSHESWFAKGINQLEKLGCKCVELRFIDTIEFEGLQDILGNTQDSRLTDIKLVFSKKPNFIFDKILQENIRISSIVIFNSETNELDSLYEVPIISISEKFDPHLTCGNINENTFLSNTYLFTESMKYNNCLNRKVSIDQNGNIKNCPSMEGQHFGNILDVNISEVLKDNRFTDVWNINKDEVNVCKGCEFRYVCTDCRVFVEDPEDKFSKPLKCGYDPSSGKWSEWSKNPLKQNAIEFYGMNTFAEMF
jgi:SPASM domain peptide maturase of grasp-with-spasm system